ncbi:MAG: diguanylate cyclase (GGDEF)-like protein [Planctomycetota bacterium]|jgi:diguanylate cyclase (GGDEF)-like protein
MRTPADADLFIVMLVGGLVATAIPAFSALTMSYAGYLLAILIPAILAYMVKNMDIDPTLLLLTAIYSALLIATAANLRKRLDSSNKLAIENARLLKRLNTEKELSDRAWKRLTEEISERQNSIVIAGDHCDMLKKMINQLPGMAYRAVNDGDWTLEYISDGCEQILEMSAHELNAQGKSTLSDILINSDTGFQNNISRTTGSASSFELEYKMITALGDERQVLEYVTKVLNDQGDLCAVEGFVVDVTERNRLSAEIERLNNHDKLTGLPNRHLFEASVQNALLSIDREHNTHNLLFIDIDQFKLVNDASGHPAGDLLLKLAAARMQSRLRRNDILARWSGDKFVVFLKNCSLDEASQIATTLCEVIESDPFQLENHSFWLTVSIGISSTKDGLCSLEELLSSAEQAAFAAKIGGRNRVHLFDRHDDILVRRSQEMQWAVEIPEAIAEGRLFIERQKIVPLNSSNDGQEWYEILLRMRDRKGDVVYPGQFLPAAELL